MEYRFQSRPAAMADVWIQPARLVSAPVKRNWIATMAQSVNFTSEPYSSAAGQSVVQALQLVHLDGRARFWGSRKSPRDEMAGGDVVVFTGQNRAHHIATVGISLANRALANQLWPESDLDEFSFVYSLADLAEIDIPYSVIWPLLGYAEDYAVRPLTFPRQDFQQAALNELFAEYLGTSEAQDLVHARDLGRRLPSPPLQTTAVELPLEQQHTRRSLRRVEPRESFLERTENALVLAYAETLPSAMREESAAGMSDLMFLRDDQRILVEAKSSSTAGSIRMAIGQLLHYALYSAHTFDAFFVLLGSEPELGLGRLLHHYGVGFIFLNSDQEFAEFPAPPDRLARLRSLVV